MIGKEVSIDLAKEFVLITNRCLKGPLYTKAMSELKHKTELIELFSDLKTYYKGLKLSNHIEEVILENIEARKSELVMF
jgi:hypothetical protein